MLFQHLTCATSVNSVRRKDMAEGWSSGLMVACLRENSSMTTSKVMDVLSTPMVIVMRVSGKLTKQTVSVHSGTLMALLTEDSGRKTCSKGAELKFSQGVALYTLVTS